MVMTLAAGGRSLFAGPVQPARQGQRQAARHDLSKMLHSPTWAETGVVKQAMAGAGTVPATAEEMARRQTTDGSVRQSEQSPQNAAQCSSTVDDYSSRCLFSALLV
jgi:hypothetical protein